MAVALYPWNTFGQLRANTRHLDTSSGVSASTAVTTTTAGGTEIQVTKTAGGSIVEWTSLRVDASGWVHASTDPIAFNIPGLESAMTVNAGLRARVYRLPADGSSPVEFPNSPYDDGAELGTSKGTMTWSGTIGGSGITLNEDDRLLLRLYIVNVGTMGTGSCTVYYGDGTDNANVFFNSTTPGFKIDTIDRIDRLAISESVTALLESAGGALTKSVADLLAISEFVKPVISPLTARLSDVTAISESTTRDLKTVHIHTDLADLIAISEFTKPVLPQLVARLSDSIAVSESVTTRMLTDLKLNLADSIALAESVTPQLALVRLKVQAIDSIALSELAKAVIDPLVVRAIDSIAVAESVAQALATVRLKVNVAETIALSESFKSPLDPLIARLQDLVAVSESVTAFIGQNLLQQVQDPIAVSESVSALIATVRLKVQAVEQVAVSESIQAALSPYIARLHDALSIAESVSASLLTVRYKADLSDLIAVSESVTALLSSAFLSRSLADIIAVSEFVQAQVSSFNLLYSTADSILVSESVAALLAYQAQTTLPTLSPFTLREASHQTQGRLSDPDAGNPTLTGYNLEGSPGQSPSPETRRNFIEWIKRRLGG